MTEAELVSWISYSSLIPPNLFILVAMIAVVVAWRRKPSGLAAATTAIGCLYLVSLPVVADLLIRWSEVMASVEPTLPSEAGPGAIVVLSADSIRSDVAGQADTVGPLTLERLAEAARRQRQLGLPILVSGGPEDQMERSLAELMSDVDQAGGHAGVAGVHLGQPD